MRKLLFSITKKDFDVETFRAGGKGGQKQNKTSSGVRIRHRDSGSVGECRNHRSQLQNKKEAFRRLVESDKFKKWHKIESAKRMGLYEGIEEKVDEMMKDENLKVEHY